MRPGSIEFVSCITVPNISFSIIVSNCTVPVGKCFSLIALCRVFENDDEGSLQKEIDTLQ